MKARHFGEVGWVAGGQVVGALGTLAGVRLLTEYVSPETFGTVMLAVGIAVLALNTACIPFTQATLRFYSELAAAEGGLQRLRLALDLCLRRVGKWFLALFTCSVLTCLLFFPNWLLLVTLIFVLVACDCARSIELSFLNAARQHRRYAIWTALDALLRPVVASVAIVLFKESPVVVLAAYIVASVALQICFGGWFSRRPASPTKLDELRQVDVMRDRIWLYAIPLIPLGVVGWSNGLADRYIIGGTLSLADAGIYAAVYGLASRAFLSWGQALELVARPIYQSAVSSGNTPRARQVFLSWLGIVGITSALGIAIVTVWRHEITSLLLAESFRAGAALLPWISAGYALRIVADVFTRVCYAHGHTSSVFLLALAGAIAGLTATTVGTHLWGLKGAAVAVVICFGVQLASAMLAAQITHKRVAATLQRAQGLA